MKCTNKEQEIVKVRKWVVKVVIITIVATKMS